MKDLIVIIGSIILGCIIFKMMVAGDDSLRGEVAKAMENMVDGLSVYGG